MMNRKRVTRLPATATAGATILIPLPPVLWQPIDGGCECSHCRGRLLVPCWDTLAVHEQRPNKAQLDYTFFVHAPELHSIVQRADFARAVANGTTAHIDIGHDPIRSDATSISRIRVHSRDVAHPKCSDPRFGYGIGICCGCDRFPVLLYKFPRADMWRCETCYGKEHGTPPANRVST